MPDDAAPREEPGFFGPLTRPLFGWLHRAMPGAQPRLGAVICNPFGYEAISAHRSIRHLATSIASAGMPCLRFDYDGTWDSAGDDLDPERVQAWKESINGAIATLRATTGIDHVCLVGVRLGALLAALVAAETGDVAALVAIAPIASGRAYLRELLALQGSHERSATVAGNAGEGGVALREALGTTLSAPAWEELGRIDLLRSDCVPAKRVLVIERDDLPQGKRWTGHLMHLGAEVHHQVVPGYPEMMRSPHESVVPEAIVRTATAWLSSLQGVGEPAACTGPHPGSALRLGLEDTPRPKAGDAPPPGPYGGERTWVTSIDEWPVRERAVHLDEARRLFGIVTDCPARSPDGARKCVVLLNSGAIHHVGPNRLYVTLARRWAALGHTVLRLDLEGLGESPAPAGARENVVYPAHAANDIASALAWLRANAPATEYHLVGLCSGAYHALKAAVAGAEVQGLAMINPLTFFWKEGMSLDYAPHHVIAESSRYRHSLMTRRFWARLLRGQVDIPNVLRIIGQRMSATVAAHVRNGLALLGVPLREDLGRELTAVAGRGVRMTFVFSDTDPGRELLRLQGGPRFARLEREGRIRVEIVDGADHTFTLRAPRNVLIDLLTNHVHGTSPAAPTDTTP